MAAADGIVTLTEKIWPLIAESDGLHDRQVIHEVVPCCADLALFKFNDGERTRLRKELGIEDRFVVVYSGSIDGWHLTEEMTDFFASLRNRNSRAYFLCLTTGEHDRIKQLMKARGVAEADYKVLALAPPEVPSYLSASDAGLAFIKRCFSKLASSPTKYAEYLGCGLPLIINAGIGDSDALVTEEQVGTLIENFGDDDYARAATVIERLATQPEVTRARSREVAERMFDVRSVGAQRYAQLYGRVLRLQLS